MSNRSTGAARLAMGYPLLRAIATTNKHSRDGIMRYLNDAGQERVSVAIKRCLTSRSLQSNTPENKLLQNLLKPRHKDLKKLAYEFKRHQNVKRKNMLLRSGNAISSILLSILPEIANSIITEGERKTNTKKKNIIMTPTPMTATKTTTAITTAATEDSGKK